MPVVACLDALIVDLKKLEMRMKRPTEPSMFGTDSRNAREKCASWSELAAIMSSGPNPTLALVPLLATLTRRLRRRTAEVGVRTAAHPSAAVSHGAHAGDTPVLLVGKDGVARRSSRLTRSRSPIPSTGTAAP